MTPDPSWPASDVVAGVDALSGVGREVQGEQVVFPSLDSTDYLSSSEGGGVGDEDDRQHQS